MKKEEQDKVDKGHVPLIISVFIAKKIKKRQYLIIRNRIYKEITVMNLRVEARKSNGRSEILSGGSN